MSNTLRLKAPETDFERGVRRFGYMLNKDGERFMARYAPEKMELVPRDLVSRSLETEILQGRGFDSPAGKYLHLDLTHLGAFVFAAQMINFTIPGTGSSGHLGGGLLLTKASAIAIPKPHGGPKS